MEKEKKRAGNVRYIFVAVLCGLALAGCGKNTDVSYEADENAQESEAAAGAEDGEDMESEESGAEAPAPIEEPEEAVAVSLDETEEEELKNDAGVLLLTSRTNDILVSIPGNQEAEDAINLFFTDRRKAYLETQEEYLNMAREEWETLETATKEPSAQSGPSANTQESGRPGYEPGREYSVKRADEQVLCIVEDCFEYIGGAHGNSWRVAYNFDTQTGERMGLEDVASDLDEIMAQSVEYLGEMLPESEYAEELFENYENDLADILTDSTWYTDEEGFHIICNEYIITPHAAGILDFVLPYEEVDVVTERYLPSEATG